MPSRPTATAIILTTFVLLLAAGAALAEEATRVYWTEWRSYHPDQCRIARAAVDGSNIETLLDGFMDGVGVKDLAIDPGTDKLYFANPAADRIERANLDGTGREDVLLDVNPVGLALDLGAGQIYFSDYTYADPRIRRVGLDGSDLQTLVSCSDGCVLEAIALDLSAGLLFWCERMDQQIWRANLDGSGAHYVLQCSDGVGHPRGLLAIGGRIWWSTDESILSATYEGDDLRTEVEGLPDTPFALEFDPFSERLYWVTGHLFGDGCVQAMNLDGSGLETLVTDLSGAYGLALEFGEAVAAPELASPITLSNYPNPFNPQTLIRLDVPATTQGSLRIHALDGTLIGTLLDGPLAAGHREVRWDGRDGTGRELPSGVYFCRLTTAEGGITRALTLIR